MSDLPASSPSMRRDVLSAYLATAARIGSWMVIAGVVMRRFGTDEFALLALVRATLSILNYGTLGLGPAMIHHLARRAPGEGTHVPRAVTPILTAEAPENVAAAPGAALSYANPLELRDPRFEVLYPLRATYAAGLKIALCAGIASAALLIVYAFNFQSIHEFRYTLRGSQLRLFVLLMGLGAIFRLISDAPAAVLQVRDSITRDNLYQCAAEAIWVAGTLGSLIVGLTLNDVARWFMASGALLLVLRLASAASLTQQFVLRLPRTPPGLTRALLAGGGVIVLGQLANYLYAPAAMILINRLLEPELVAYYEAGVQIDAALLLLVTALATVVLPKAAVAHAADDHVALRRYYLRGTLASLAMLVAGAVAAWALAPWIFPLWLGQEMRTTRAILPILLLSTVIGGSGMVGRSILLATGKAKAFTAAALAAGVANVLLALTFVKLGFGLHGIVGATAVVVVARAGIWLPWYVMRTLRLSASGVSASGLADTAAAQPARNCFR
ncbi:MAG TPA: MATE family efflux transporter [Tepidisphaeraceae bacterium]|nr:MATE family efflux transporter [Tepidisphaeraceae bacterium]